jgi:shikimate dehydrogenase
VINNKTNLYFSISSNPGSSGSLLHNSFFKIINKNAIYLPLKVKNLKNFINFFKDINSHGFSVSTPYKSKVIKYLDNKDKIVKETLSCNTVIKKQNKLFGYNTDYLAIYHILKLKIKNKKSKILILGNGAVTRSVLFALKNLKFKNILVCSRKQKNLPKNQFINFNKINFCKADVIINTTSLGMNIKKKDKLKINKYLIKSLSLIIDFPISQKNSPFFKDVSDKNNIKYISGKEISFFQGIYQIKLYNNLNNIMKYYEILKKNLIKK